MKKMFLLVFMVLMLFAMVSACAAGEDDSALSEQFSHLLYREGFNTKNTKEYYRFPTVRLMYDPLDLMYFPHDKLWEYDWSLLRRKNNSGIYEQTMVLSKPSTGMVIQGTGIGREYGVMADFYLYATLFTSDTYPVDKGSCYVYFSDSFIHGFHLSHGILIDPGSGIYQAENSYGWYYEPALSRHDLTLLKSLDPEDFLSPDGDPPSATFASEFDPAVDEQFLEDFNTMITSYRMEGSPEVKAYRIELIRKGLFLDVFINGKRIVRMLDSVTSEDKDGIVTPNKVSWSYGPILYPGGITTTCAIGDLYIYGTLAERKSLFLPGSSSEGTE